MTMHLAHPSLSLNGKKKGKRKFRSAAAAAAARQQQAEWEDLKARWGQGESKKQTKADFKEYKPKINPLLQRKDQPKKDPTLVSWDPCVKVENRQYTGDKIVGIGTLHKSNAVPVFSDQEAKDLSSMRR